MPGLVRKVAVAKAVTKPGPSPVAKAAVLTAPARRRGRR